MGRIPDIAIVGGGLLGRLLAWRASRAGLTVALYEAGGRLGERSAAWAAAGMITPTAEAVDADTEIVAMGRHSLTLWPTWLDELAAVAEPVFYRDRGTLLLWHRQDAAEAQRFRALVAARDHGARMERVGGAQIAELEPALGERFPQALYIPGEAQIDNRGVLAALATALDGAAGVTCHWDTPVGDRALPAAGIVVDCRGMGDRNGWSELRGVRGEIVRLHAPEVQLEHMLRLLHPRYSVYVAPRPNGHLIVGATSVESDDRSGMSVRGALELLSSAYSLLPALAEARIEEFTTQVRPALADNRPAFHYDEGAGVLHINGLYRHGFLLSPAVVEEALEWLLAEPSCRGEGRWDCLRTPAAEAVSSEKKGEICQTV